MLTLVAMERPKSLSADAIRDEKVHSQPLVSAVGGDVEVGGQVCWKGLVGWWAWFAPQPAGVLRTVRAINPEDVVLGQYVHGPGHRSVRPQRVLSQVLLRLQRTVHARVCQEGTLPFT